ncbi:hypothetical protein ACWEMN_53435, partial [Streptomyces mirabilis]
MTRYLLHPTGTDPQNPRGSERRRLGTARSAARHAALEPDERMVTLDGRSVPFSELIAHPIHDDQGRVIGHASLPADHAALYRPLVARLGPTSRVFMARRAADGGYLVDGLAKSLAPTGAYTFLAHGAQSAEPGSPTYVELLTTSGETIRTSPEQFGRLLLRPGFREEWTRAGSIFTAVCYSAATHLTPTSFIRRLAAQLGHDTPVIGVTGGVDLVRDLNSEATALAVLDGGTLARVLFPSRSGEPTAPTTAVHRSPTHQEPRTDWLALDGAQRAEGGAPIAETRQVAFDGPRSFTRGAETAGRESPPSPARSVRERFSVGGPSRDEAIGSASISAAAFPARQTTSSQPDVRGVAPGPARPSPTAVRALAIPRTVLAPISGGTGLSGRGAAGVPRSNQPQPGAHRRAVDYTTGPETAAALRGDQPQPGGRRKVVEFVVGSEPEALPRLSVAGQYAVVTAANRMARRAVTNKHNGLAAPYIAITGSSHAVEITAKAFEESLIEALARTPGGRLLTFDDFALPTRERSLPEAGAGINAELIDVPTPAPLVLAGPGDNPQTVPKRILMAWFGGRLRQSARENLDSWRAATEAGEGWQMTVLTDQYGSDSNARFFADLKRYSHVRVDVIAGRASLFHDWRQAAEVFDFALWAHAYHLASDVARYAGLHRDGGV